MQLYTARYQEFLPEWGIPVRSTLGNPRFRLPYTLAGWWRGVTPRREWFHSEFGDFRRSYRHMLHQQGLDRLMTEAAAFLGKDEDPAHARLVVLCFDDIRKPGVWCHRELMGEWFTEQGVPVIELCGPAAGAPEPVAPPPPVLF
jgi:hypothetical protein